MKLTELDPHWIQPPQWSPQAAPFYIGVSFLCPHCTHGPCPTCGNHRGKRLAFHFWPPIDPTDILARITPLPHDGYHQRVSGDTFDTLTIAPSIGLQPHWHGHITNGEMT